MRDNESMLVTTVCIGECAGGARVTVDKKVRESEFTAVITDVTGFAGGAAG